MIRGRVAYEAKYVGHFSPLHKEVLEGYRRAGTPFGELTGLRTTPPYLRKDEEPDADTISEDQDDA